MSYNPQNINGQATMANSSPVVLASDQSPINVTLQAGTSGGAGVFHLVSAAGTNATRVTGVACKVFGWYLYNSSNLPRKIIFYNSAANPPVLGTTTLYFTVILPGYGAANVAFPTGIDFPAGLGIAMTQGIADSDNTGVLVNEVMVNIFYK
jgi:hypothetical protein